MKITMIGTSIKLFFIYLIISLTLADNPPITTNQLKQIINNQNSSLSQLTQKLFTYFPSNISHTPQNFIKQWSRTLTLNKFQQILHTFPFFVRNMHAPIMAQLHSQQACYHRELKRPATEFAIIDNQAYLVGMPEESPGLGERLTIYLRYLKRVVKRMAIPDLYFVVVLEDALRERAGIREKRWACNSMPLFMFNKNISSDYQANKFLIPDLYIVHRMDQQMSQTARASALYPWSRKTPKLYFRGAPTSTHFDDVPLRDSMSNYQLLKYYPRGGFVLLSLDFPELIDAKFVEPNGFSVYIERRIGKDKNITTTRANKKDHIQFKYLLSADGHGTAWKRPAWIMHSNSILFKVFSEEVQYFYEWMVPGQNFILIRDDLSDMFQKMDQLNKDDKRALRVVQKANQMAMQHLTPQAIQQFGGRQLIKFASHQKLNLTIQEKQMFKNGTRLTDILIVKRQQQIIELDELYKQNWINAIKFVSFDDTIAAFPILQSNTNYKKLLRIVQRQECSPNLIGFLIADNKVYIHSGINNSLTNKFFNFFTAVAESERLDDMYFLVALDDDQVGYEQDVCRNFPIFAASKNILQPDQKSRLLIPHQNMVKDWQNITTEQNYTKQYIEWDKKQGKAFWRGYPDIPFQTISKDIDIYSKYHAAGFVLLSNQRPDLVDAKFIEASESNPLVSQVRKRIWKGEITPNDTKQPKQKWQQYKYRLIPESKNNNNNSNVDNFIETLSSNSIIMKPFSNRVHWFYDRLVPGVHFIPLAEDLSDMFTKIKKFNENDTGLLQIIENANVIAEQLVNMKQIVNETATILQKYSKIQNLHLPFPQKSNLIAQITTFTQNSNKYKFRIFFQLIIFIIFIFVIGFIVVICYIFYVRKFREVKKMIDVQYENVTEQEL